MKRISYIMLIVILMSSFLTVHAADIDTTAAKLDNKTFALEEIFTQLEKSNPEILLMDKKIGLLTKQYDEALERSKSFPHQASEKMSKVEIVKEERLNWKSKLLELNNMKHDREEKLKQIKNDVEKMFADITIMQVQRKSLQEQLTAVDQRIAQMQLKIKLGMLKSTDIKQLEAQKIKLDSELKSLDREVTILLSDIKKVAGINASTNITIKDYSYTYKSFNEYQVDMRIQNAVTGSYDIAKAKEELELLKIERDIVYHFSDDPQMDVEQLDMDINVKEAEIDDLNTSVESKLRTNYFALLNFNDAIEIAKIDKEIAELNLKKGEAQYKVGKITEMDVLDLRIALIKQEAQLMQAIGDYMKASKDFDNELSIEIPAENK